MNKKVLYGASVVAIAFSDYIKEKTVWLFPLMALFFFVVVFYFNVEKGFGNQRGNYIAKSYFVFGIIPYTAIFMYSLMIMLVRQKSTKFFTRSMGSFLIAVLTVVISAALVYVFQRNAPDIICYGLVLNYFLHILFSVRIIGIMGFVKHLLNPLDTYQKIFELHSIGFTLNLLLIYYFVKRDRKDIGKIVMILFVLYMIMKRIALVGVLVAFLVSFFTDVLLKKCNSSKYKIIQWILALSSLLYVCFICVYPDIYRLFMDKLGILNRYLMAISFDDYYRLDIRFLGEGFGFVSVMMPKMDIAGAAVAALHNDILKDYIEVGFVVFCIIYFYFFVGLPQKLFRTNSKRAVSCVTMLLVYTFITLLTDNVFDYIPYMCALFTLYGTIHMYGNDLFPNKVKYLREIRRVRN